MKIEALNWRFRFDINLRKIATVEGIDSDILDDDRHILLWDFDDTPLLDVVGVLQQIQSEWALPTIKIMQSSANKDLPCYHAYCFKALPLPLVIHILAATPFIDWTYFKLGVVRGFWTLRISQKQGNPKTKILPVTELKNDCSEDLWVLEKLRISEYSTEVFKRG